MLMCLSLSLCLLSSEKRGGCDSALHGSPTRVSPQCFHEGGLWPGRRGPQHHLPYGGHSWAQPGLSGGVSRSGTVGWEGGDAGTLCPPLQTGDGRRHQSQDQDDEGKGRTAAHCVQVTDTDRLNHTDAHFSLCCGISARLNIQEGWKRFSLSR